MMSFPPLVYKTHPFKFNTEHEKYNVLFKIQATTPSCSFSPCSGPQNSKCYYLLPLLFILPSFMWKIKLSRCVTQSICPPATGTCPATTTPTATTSQPPTEPNHSSQIQIREFLVLENAPGWITSQMESVRETWDLVRPRIPLFLTTAL